MGGKGGRVPSPDPNIGQAALESAETGRQVFDFMRQQADISNQWAEADRRRYRTVFEPLQDQYIAEAQEGPDYSDVGEDVRRAVAEVSNRFDSAQQQQDRRLQAAGVDPRSGRYREAARDSEIAEALGTARAANMARERSRTAAEAEANQMEANAINMGSGLAVNPATALGLSNNAYTSGGGAQMQGLGQQGQLLNTQYQQQMQAYGAKQQNSANFWGGIGQIAGMGLALASSEEWKEDKKPARGVLDAVRKMPVEEWTYKEGHGDGGRHVGPYAEDFHAATGRGDGRTIPVIDAIGVTIGAVQELDKEMRKGNAKAAPSDRKGAGPTPKSIMGAIERME